MKYITTLKITNRYSVHRLQIKLVVKRNISIEKVMSEDLWNKLRGGGQKFNLELLGPRKATLSETIHKNQHVVAKTPGIGSQQTIGIEHVI